MPSKTTAEPDTSETVGALPLRDELVEAVDALQADAEAARHQHNATGAAPLSVRLTARHRRTSAESIHQNAQQLWNALHVRRAPLSRIARGIPVLTAAIERLPSLENGGDPYEGPLHDDYLAVFTDIERPAAPGEK